MGRRSWDLRAPLGFARTMAREFRWTLGGLLLAVLFGSLLYRLTPHGSLGGHAPSFGVALFGAWMALFAQPILTPPETWYLGVVCGLYPLLGFGLIGEGIVRLGMLVISRQQREKEWMRVMASTYRDHVVLCGLGHLGYRTLGELLGAGQRVVAIEKDPNCRFLAAAKATKTPVLVRDMKEDDALVQAGVEHARTIIIATNDDMANLEVAIDSRRMNPGIRVVMRLFDQQIADKIKDAFLIDEAFSSTALAAPVVAALSQEAGVLASFSIGGVPFAAAELRVEAGSAWEGRTIEAVEAAHALRVLARTAAAAGAPSPPAAATVLAAGDGLVVHAPVARLGEVAAAARARASAAKRA